MKSRAVVVIFLAHIHSRELVAPQSVHVAGRRRKQKTHDVQAFRFVLVAARVLFVNGVPQIIVAVKVEHADKLLHERELRLTFSSEQQPCIINVLTLQNSIPLTEFPD